MAESALGQGKQNDRPRLKSDERHHFLYICMYMYMESQFQVRIKFKDQSVRMNLFEGVKI